MKPSNVCLPESEIPLLLSGDLPPEEIASAEKHIANCVACREAIESKIADSRWWDDARHSLVACATRSRNHVAASLRDVEDSASLGEMRLREQMLNLLGPTDDPAMLGRIGVYEIVGILGHGGMGVVFKGYDGALSRYVAIKMLLPHLAAHGAARKRFAREAQAAAAVVDDHVMAIHGVSEWNSVPYFVMPYARGVSLQKRLTNDGPLELREVLRVGMQAAKGLAAAHAQGLVHRDVKPANIFLDEGVERVQLMDFGLARAVDDASLTQSGTLAGTPQYMSPEQARAETVDHRSDLFSLGSVLYAMCTGHAPFRAESSFSVLRLITDKEPRPIHEINPDIPVWLCTIISKLMSKQASDRFDSAEQVAELLEDCLAHVQQPTTTPLPEAVSKLAAELSKSFGSHASKHETESLGDSRYPPIGKLIAAAAFAFSLIFPGVLIVLELNKGTLTIESNADNVPIRIMQGDDVVERLTVTKSPQNVRIAAGNYVVELDGDFEGVTIKDGIVSLARRGTASVGISKQAKLVLSSNFQPGNLDGLRFGERHERDQPMDRGYANDDVAEPGEKKEVFASFPVLDNGVEEVGLIVSVEPPHESTEPSNMQSYLVRTSGSRRIKNYSSCEASAEGESFFTPDDTPYTVGYLRLHLEGEVQENVTIEMIAGLAHVNITYVVGLPNEQVRKLLQLDPPNGHSESWLHAGLPMRPQSAWASHLMKIDGWEQDRTRGVPNMVQQEVALKSGETRTVSIEPADGTSEKTVPSKTTRTLSVRLLGDRKLAIADPNAKDPSPQPFTSDGFSLKLPLDRRGVEKGYHIVNDQFESIRAVVRLECSESMPEEFWRRLDDQSIDISIAHSDFVRVRSSNLTDRVVYLPLASSGGNEIQTKSSFGIGRPFDLVEDIRKFSGQPIVSLRLDPPTAADQVAQSYGKIGPAFSSGEQEIDEQKVSDSFTQGRGKLLKQIPESGTVLVMFGDGSENSRQMVQVARKVVESTSIQLIEQPLAEAPWIVPAAGPVKRGKNAGSNGPQFVLIKDRQQVAMLNGLLTEKRLRDFVRTADNWLTPHSTGVKESSLVRIDCYINPGNGNTGKQIGGAHPLTTAVVAVFEDQALLLGPDSISEYLDKGFSCVAMVRDESGQQIQLPLDIVHVGPVPLMGRDKEQKRSAATANITFGDGQTAEVPLELSGYPASATAVLDAYETGAAIYLIRGAFGLSSVRLAEIDDLPEVGQSVLSGGFYRDRQSLPRVDFGSPIQWQSQLVKSRDGSIYGGNLNGAELMDVLCPAVPSPVGFTFNEHGRLIGKYGLGHPTEKDMTHTVFLPDTTHSVLQAAAEKIKSEGLKTALSLTLYPQPALNRDDAAVKSSQNGSASDASLLSWKVDAKFSPAAIHAEVSRLNQEIAAD